MKDKHQSMSVDELQRLTEDLSQHWFGKPFLHRVQYNSRLRTTGGRYMLKDHSIQLNPIVEMLHGTEEVIGVIKHELCHYHLHIEGRGYKHGDSEFKELLKKTESPRFCKPLRDAERPPRQSHYYTCTSCGLVYERKRRVDIKRYNCGKCHGKLRKTRH